MKMKSASYVAILLLVCVSAHAGWRIEGETKYKPPESVTGQAASRVLDLEASRDTVWMATVSYISQTSFAIDQISKDSGLVSIKFSEADPRRVIDCGILDLWVSNLRGRRTYTVEGAQPQALFEEYAKGKILGVERSVALTGVINIFVISIDQTHTSVRLNVRYVVAKRNVIHDVAAEMLGNVPPTVLTSSIAFNSGEVGSDDGGSATKCASRFVLERQLLEGIALELSKISGTSPLK